MFRGSKMAAWAGSADILRASSVKTAIKNTGIKCVNNPYSAFLTDKTVPLNASTSLTVPVYVTGFFKHFQDTLFAFTLDIWW